MKKFNLSLLLYILILLIFGCSSKTTPTGNNKVDSLEYENFVKDTKIDSLNDIITGYRKNNGEAFEDKEKVIDSLASKVQILEVENSELRNR